MTTIVLSDADKAKISEKLHVVHWDDENSVAVRYNNYECDVVDYVRLLELYESIKVKIEEDVGETTLDVYVVINGNFVAGFCNDWYQASQLAHRLETVSNKVTIKRAKLTF